MAVQGHTIPTSALSQEVKDILNDYINGVSEKQREIAEVISQECSSELKSAGTFKGTKYRKSWTFKPNTVGRRVISFTVYNEKHYRLTHLLEDGHASANQYGGGYGTVPAYEHIEPIEKKFIKEFEQRLKEAVSK